MNKLLYKKVLKDTKNKKLANDIIIKLQNKFKVKDSDSVFDIEKKITDKDYSAFIK